MTPTLQKHHYYCFINKSLIPIKVAGFIHTIGHGAIYSFLPIQARSLGMSASQIGLILSILPVAILLGPPIFSPLADKLQKHKLFLIFFMLLSAGFYLLLTTVPTIPSSTFACHTNVTNCTGNYHEFPPSNQTFKPVFLGNDRRVT